MFELEDHSGKTKGVCPQCEKAGVFVYYKDFPHNLNFGRCDRENSCGYHNKPTRETIKENNLDVIDFVQKPKIIKTTVYPKKNDLKVLQDLSSVLHKFCRNQLQISDVHFQKWNLGTNKFKNTVFGYKSKTGFLNLKTIAYELIDNNSNCKRNKRKNPFYLKAGANEQFKRCLYGEHLLSADKIVCLVESEKTALIASFFYSQFDFLATGGASGIKSEQLRILKDKTVYYLPDNDKAGKENSTIRNLIKEEINFQMIDFPTANEGEDLADLIIKGERPEIKPKEEMKQVKPPIETKSNSFTLLRDYLLNTWDFRLNIVRNEMEYKFRDETEFKDLVSNDIWVNLKENGVQFKKDDFNAILGSSIMEKYNPIKEYFSNLPKWDKKIDHIENLILHLRYNGKVCIKNHFKKWIVRAVKCAIDDSYFNKQIFVIVGNQNDGKSTFVRFLVPNDLEKYYTENPDFKNKDGEIALAQNFIINMDELANIGRQDTDKLKTFISKVSTNVRRPFARNTKTESRKASFMGTTNNDEFLTDHTGNVRWLNFKIDGIYFKYSIDININDVWAQAYELYKCDFDCEISKEEMNEIEENNREFKIQTEEMQIVKEYFLEPNTNDKNALEFLTTSQIKEYLERINPNIRLNLNRLGKALSSLGFQKESKRLKEFGYSVKGYWVIKQLTI